VDYFVLSFLPYITLVVFAVGMGYRFYVWSKTPQPGAITLFPAPGPDSAGLKNIVKEVLLFPSLFKGDRSLWVIAWIFHATLALIAIGHVRVFTDFPRLWAALGINADNMSAISGGIAGVVITLCAILLIGRRLTMKRVREATNLSDHLALLLIMGVLVTGNLMRFGPHFDLALTREYFIGLATFSVTSASLPQSGMFVLHFLLAQTLIIFIPFSKIMHLGGIFFTKALIQKA
jgi:nitrate reductase gamma subunit